ncbi:MAG TPA: hypothetical protein VGS96_17520 [Thermoanaerobaculia bacterium]|nr:hypothetical protein [Thermoanaerobaculia bacterium]
MHSRRIFVLGALVLFVAAATLGATAKGTLTVNGKTFNLKNVYATNRKNPFDKKKTDVVVILSDKELPAGAQFDEFALMSLPEQGVSGITFEVDPDKRINSGTLFSPSFKKMKQFSSTGNQKLDLTTSTKDRIAGSISIKPDNFFEENFQYSATFDAPILTKPPEKPVALKGTPLPADGGEPAKAWQAHRKAIAAGDMAAIRKTIAAEHLKDLDDPDFKKMLPLMKEMQPKKVKITGGSIDGDTATLLVKNLDEKNSNATVTMRREGGQWKLVKEAWKTTSE